VFGPRLAADLEVLARLSTASEPKLEKQFQKILQVMGFSPPERKALAAVTPAKALAPKAGQLADAFLELVEYNGRRLAKLHAAPERIILAIEEYAKLLEVAAKPMSAARQKQVREAIQRWRFSAALTLNNAFYQVAEAESHAYQELFRIELEAEGLDDLLLRMLSALSHYCKADSAVLYLAEPAGAGWRLTVATGSGITGRLAGERLILSARKIRRLGRGYCRIARRGGTLGALPDCWQGRYATCWSIPLMHEGTQAGVMQFAFSVPYKWLPREVELLSAAADRCMLAAEKARLVERLAAREEDIRGLAERLLQAEERERRRISADLHDEAGQSLLCVRLQLEVLEQLVPASLPELAAGLAETRLLTEKTIVEVRRLISALRPAVLDHLGLAPALRQLRSRFERLHKVEVSLSTGSLTNVPQQIASAVYRLVQECLNNVAKHSKATRVMISLNPVDEELRLCVADNGVGFHVGGALARRGSFGMAGMSERVALLGGRFQVDSRPGRGTKVQVALPLLKGRKPSTTGS
jgi:signal transduction histidine kinase